MKIFMFDNYDSFTYNLVQYFQILGCDVTARRCDCTTVDAVFALRPDAIVLSPGPGRPESAGILLELIREGLARQMPMLGVCLGHQAICEADAKDRKLSCKIPDRRNADTRILRPPRPR